MGECGQRFFVHEVDVLWCVEDLGSVGEGLLQQLLIVAAAWASVERALVDLVA